MSDRDRIDDLLIRGIDKVEEKIDKLDAKIDHTHDSLVLHTASDDVIQKSIDQHLDRMTKILDNNTESLKEHIAGVNTLKQLHLDNVSKINKQETKQEKIENRIEKLEEPKKALTLIGKWIIGISAVGVAIAKFIGLF